MNRAPMEPLWRHTSRSIGGPAPALYTAPHDYHLTKQAITFAVRAVRRRGERHAGALGIRQAADIDIAVLPALHTALRATGKWDEDERYGEILQRP